MRTSGIFPIRRADENFAVAPALPAMKLVNRHGRKIAGAAKISSVETERDVSAPEARKKIARSFNCGFVVEKRKAPAGAVENFDIVRFCRPCRGLICFDVLPRGLFSIVAPRLGCAAAQPYRSRRQFFAVRQMVAIPADQGGVAGVFKKKLQRRRFDVAVTKYHVGSALMAQRCVMGFSQGIGEIIFRAAKEIRCVWNKCFSHRHHVAWISYF
jgi:hypothetical protein